MKPYKMVGIALAAFALASFAMAAAPRLVEHGIAMVHAQRTAAAPSAVPAPAPPAKPAASDQQSAIEKTAIATAQEATTLQQ
jgi:hypothetical protein